MPADFFPKRESEIVNWSNVFNDRINAPGSATDLGLTGAQAADYASLQQSFVSLYQLACDNSTRTPAIIQAKNTARVALEKYTRQLANIIRAHPGVDATQRVLLGLPLRRRGGPPGKRWTQSFPTGREHSPLLNVVSVNGSRVRLRLRDRSSPMNSGKPPRGGVIGATVFYCVGEWPAPVADLSKWRFLRHTSRTVFDVKFGGRSRDSGGSHGPLLAAGTKVWFAAFWENRRCQRSAACDPIYTHLQYGLALAA